MSFYGPKTIALSENEHLSNYNADRKMFPKNILDAKCFTKYSEPSNCGSRTWC